MRGRRALGGSSGLPLLLLLLMFLALSPATVLVVLAGIRGADAAGADEPLSSTEPPCSLYLAWDDQVTDSWALYSGVAREAHTVLLEPEELVLPVVRPNKNEYSPWHDYSWPQDPNVTEGWMLGPQQSRLLLNNKQQDNDDSTISTVNTMDLLISGLGALTTCSANPNLTPARDRVTIDNDSSSSSPIHNFHYQTAGAPVEPGEALTVDCGNGDDETEKVVVPLSELERDGVCLDTLDVRPSSTVAGERGAFTKRAVSANDVVAISPVVHFDRSQLEIVRQERKTKHKIPLARDHNIEYQATVVEGQQLLQNYCYGHPDSNVMLLPVAPGVNFINHASGRSSSSNSHEPNVRIRWVINELLNHSNGLQVSLPVMELFEEPAGILVVKFVALRDIAAGEEILIDYGPEWEQAWENYQENNDGSSKPFRHEIGVPIGFYHRNWNKADPQPYGDFIASPLSTGHMAPIRWAESAEVVTPWAFRVGLHSRVRTVLLDYCNRMGITDILRHVTVQGNGLEAGTETHMDVQGDDWYLQRPDSNWRSNLHWFSPGAAPAHEHYLQALSVAGFDEILDGIGQHLGLDGLVAFHVTFIGVSHSTRGYLHHDVVETDGKVYNVIIPLILANETGPELDLQGWKPDLDEDDAYNSRVGRYRYEYDVASMMGDGAVHATSACDYRNTKEMRMAATVYIADVNDKNIRNVMKHYTQAYPPKDLDLLKSWMGRHWKRGDPSRSLPKPPPGHILYNYTDNRVGEATEDVVDEL